MSLKDGLLSLEMRKHFNLPLTGGTGLSLEERKQLIRQYADLYAKQGKDAEDRFIQAWEAQREKRGGYKGFVSIRRATPEEDRTEKTDAFIEIKKLGTIRVQIKSSITTSGEFKKFCRMDIVLISILPSDTPQTIVNKTVDLISKFHSFQTHPKRNNRTP